MTTLYMFFQKLYSQSAAMIRVSSVLFPSYSRRKQRRRFPLALTLLLLTLQVFWLVGCRTRVEAQPSLQSPGSSPTPRIALPLVTTSDNTPAADSDWWMVGANPQRTSWVSEEVRGKLGVEWYRPIEPYIPFKVQVIARHGNLYISTARGLYALNAADGNVNWVYPTELPLGHSPTVAIVGGKSIAYVGGYDRKIHAIDALTGQAISGYTPYEAEAGFETNPLVINGLVYAGNRDGYFYAFDALTGALRWRYKTEGPILFSAAYKNGVVYFASNDAHAYALNAASGALIWKSPRLPGAGFHSYWPVVYTEKMTGKDYVVFTVAENNRQGDGVTRNTLDAEHFFPGCRNIDPYTCPPSGELLGPSSLAASNDPYWSPSTSLINASRITDYYEDYPHRRISLIFDATTGQEYSFDSDADGKLEYAPMTWSGVTYSGNKYPPVINHADGIFYQSTMYVSSGGWIPRGDVVGWKFGSQFVSRVQAGNGHAIDEPMAFSSGGNLIYWSLCCDREAGAIDVTIPFGQANRSWNYYNTGGSNLIGKAPDYGAMYNDGDAALYTNLNGWQVYSGKDQSKNGVYGKHGTTQSPPIPYAGKVYMLKGNAIIAWSPTATTPTKLPMAPIVAASQQFSPVAPDQLRQRLEQEVQKMLAAGHLRPGYHSAGFIDQYGQGGSRPDRVWGELFDYFQNPAETVVTLIQALPHLSAALQAQVKDYLQTYYGPQGQYPFTSIVHIGWQNGAAREVYEIPPEAQPAYASFAPRTTARCEIGSCGWESYPPYSFYAAWKYAQVFGGGKLIFDQMSSKLETPPTDAFFTTKPYVLNQYIAGYLGYLELQKLAGYPESTSVRNTLNHLLNIRAANFSKDVPWVDMEGLTVHYQRALSVASNFMYLTPELGDYLSQNALSKVQAALSEYNYVAPYWFVSKFDNSMGEGTLQHLYDYPSLFQAKAYALRQPYSELVKYLDVPAFERGDLFYIQNIVAALQAPQ